MTMYVPLLKVVVMLAWDDSLCRFADQDQVGVERVKEEEGSVEDLRLDSSHLSYSFYPWIQAY